MLSKVLDMSKIRNVIYRPDIHNLPIRIVFFPYQEKLLEEVDGS